MFTKQIYPETVLGPTAYNIIKGQVAIEQKL